MLEYLEELMDEIYDELEEELEEDEEGGSFNETLLMSKVKSATREVLFIRRYPSSYTKEMIVEDMQNYHAVIHNVALYDYNTIGMEFETEHFEKNTTRNFSKRSSMFYGVLPITKIL